MVNQRSNDEGLRELALFAGAGGGILGGKLLGWRTVCAVEWDAYAASVLVARQNDGCLEAFPIWDDVQTFDGKPWRGLVDVVSGGFPCQDISSSGRGAGIDGKRSGMWKHMARIVGEVRPKFVFVENSPLLVKRGLAVVIGDLAALGYDARWGIVGAHHVAAPHKRDRIWIVGSNVSNSKHTGFGGVWEDESERKCKKMGRSQQSGRNGCNGNVANTKVCSDVENSNCSRMEKYGSFNTNSFVRSSSTDASEKSQENSSNGIVANSSSGRQSGDNKYNDTESENVSSCCAEKSGGWWSVEPRLDRVANGVACRVDRLKAIGNGQVSAVARLAWSILSQE